MDDPTPFDELPAEDVHIEAIEGFHLGGNRYSVSFELSDHNGEIFRSYLLDVNLDKTLTFSVRLQIENTIMSSAALGSDRFLALRIGGRMYHLFPEGDFETFLPNGVLRRIHHVPTDVQYVVGDDGACYIRERGAWEEVPPLSRRALRDIHGPSSDLIYVCGHGGTLQHLQNRQWSAIDLKDHRDFTAIEVASADLLHIGGPGGLALSLRDGELVELDAPKRDFFCNQDVQGASLLE